METHFNKLHTSTARVFTRSRVVETETITNLLHNPTVRVHCNTPTTNMASKDEFMDSALEEYVDEEVEYHEDLCHINEQEHELMMAVLGAYVYSNIRENNHISSVAIPLPHESAWAHLITGADDPSFIDAVGINKAGFYNLLKTFRRHYVHRYHLGRGGRPSRISTEQALGVVLQFYRCPTEQRTLGQLHGCQKCTIGRILEKAEKALNATLQETWDARVKWPSVQTQKEWYGIKNQLLWL